MSNAVASDPESGDCIIEIVQSAEGFFALQTDWERLRQARGDPVIFQSWFWNWVWWKHLSPPGSCLCIVTCRDRKGELVGLVPFYLYTRQIFGCPIFRQLRFIGTNPYVLINEYLDFLIHPGSDESKVLGQFAKAIRDRIHWDSLWLALHLPSSFVSRFLVPALREFLCPPCSILSFRIDTTGSWKEYLSQRGRRTRQNIQTKTTRVLKKQKACFREISSSSNECHRALEALERFHRTRWLPKGSLGAFAISGFGPFLREMIGEGQARQQLRIWTINHNGEISAVMVAFFEQGNTWAFQMGFDPKYEKESLGFVLVGLCIRACFEDSTIRLFALLSGCETFKTLWTKQQQMLFTHSGFRKGLRSAIFFGIEYARAGGKSMLRALLPAAHVAWIKIRLSHLRKTR